MLFLEMLSHARLPTKYKKIAEPSSYYVPAAKSSVEPLTWAVSARSESKLRAMLDQASQNRGEDLTGVPVILADTSDDASLEAMARRARLVLNCVGPYRFWGKPVVAACVKEGAHHIDISGESHFLESMQLRVWQIGNKVTSRPDIPLLQGN